MVAIKNIQQCINKYCKSNQDGINKLINSEAKKLEKDYNLIKTFNDVEKYYKSFLLITNNKIYKKQDKCEIKYCNKFINNLKDNLITPVIKPLFDILLPIIKSLQKKPVYIDELTKDIDRLLALPVITRDDVMRLSFYMLLTSIIVSKGM